MIVKIGERGNQESRNFHSAARPLESNWKENRLGKGGPLGEANSLGPYTASFSYLRALRKMEGEPKGGNLDDHADRF